MDFLGGGTNYGQEGGADEPGIAYTYTGTIFMVIIVLLTIAFGMIIFLIVRTNGIQESIGKMDGQVKSSTGVFSALSEALKGKFDAKPPR